MPLILVVIVNFMKKKDNDFKDFEINPTERDGSGVSARPLWSLDDKEQNEKTSLTS
jgi:hypothetical protein